MAGTEQQLKDLGTVDVTNTKNQVNVGRLPGKELLSLPDDRNNPTVTTLATM